MLKSLEWEWHFTLLFSCINRIALPSLAARGTPPPPRVIDYPGFEGKTVVLAAASPRTAAPGLPGPVGHRALLASQGVELGSRARSCAQECQGGRQPAWVSILKGSCGLAAGRRPTAVAAIQHPFNSRLRGCDSIRFPQRSTLCMNYSVSLFYAPRGTDDASALSGEAVTVVREWHRAWLPGQVLPEELFSK